MEAIDVDYKSGQPATTFLLDALSSGSHAVSANKGPVVHHHATLLSTAKANGVRYVVHGVQCSFEESSEMFLLFSNFKLAV